MKREPTSRTVTPTRGQKSEWNKFVDALEKGKISLARDLITHIFLYTKLIVGLAKCSAKDLGYRLICELAIEMGDLDAALEVAPFCGHQMQKEDYLACKKSASNAGRSKDRKACVAVIKREWGR